MKTIHRNCICTYEYKWTCPDCGEYNFDKEIADNVACMECGEVFKVIEQVKQEVDENGQ